jgi:hypothetical protein
MIAWACFSEIKVFICLGGVAQKVKKESICLVEF